MFDIIFLRGALAKRWRVVKWTGGVAIPMGTYSTREQAERKLARLTGTSK